MTEAMRVIPDYANNPEVALQLSTSLYSVRVEL
jgi:hypothetical protein